MAPETSCKIGIASAASLSPAARLAALLQRHPWLIPAGSFAFGWLSFILVKRGESLARWIACVALLSWLWLLAEPRVRRSLERRRPGVGNFVANFLTQSLQQEMLFFALPFIVGATQRDVGQIGFALLAMAAALLATLDPIYVRYVASRSTWRMLFQGYCSVIAAVVVLPMVVHLPVERALLISLVSVAAWLLFSLRISLGAPSTRRQTALWIGTSVALPLALWLLRGQVPAAGIVVTEALITRSLEALTPGEAVTKVAAANLSDGVIAFAAIRAPMGLAQVVVFEWRHADHEERIVAEIHGGRENGFRTYARKRIFPLNAQGRWTVDILTPQRQLLQRLRFDVEADPASLPASQRETLDAQSVQGIGEVRRDSLSSFQPPARCIRPNAHRPDPPWNAGLQGRDERYRQQCESLRSFALPSQYPLEAQASLRSS